LAYLLNFIRARVRKEKTLSVLSKRYSEAASELGLRHVPQVFNAEHGRMTSLHYRTLAEVMPVIICDQFPEDQALHATINATIKWYWRCRSRSFSPADIDALAEETAAMQVAWQQIDEATPRPASSKELAKSGLPSGLVLDTPKFHRAVEHIVEYVRNWGPIEYLTTETSESLHKPLKVMFRWYVNCCFASVLFVSFILISCT
jgi:hypothetical protein